MPSITNTRPMAVRKSIMASALASAGLEALEEFSVRLQDQRRVVAGEAAAVRLHRAVEGVEFRVAAEGFGVDLDGLLVALAAQDLRLLFGVGDEYGALLVGGGADFLRCFLPFR